MVLFLEYSEVFGWGWYSIRWKSDGHRMLADNLSDFRTLGFTGGFTCWCLLGKAGIEQQTEPTSLLCASYRAPAGIHSIFPY